MFAFKEAVVVSCVFAFTVTAVRVMRAPDKMEVNIPNYSYERESGEHQENMKQEAEYWQGQGDKVSDREEEGHRQLEDDRDNNQNTYENEKEHHTDQQHNNNKEMNETYQADRNKAETHHDTNQEHYMQHHDNANYDTPSQANKTANDVTNTETGDRYEEKGSEYATEGQDKVQNPEMSGESPSISYSRN